jgi:hypothetical protein
MTPVGYAWLIHHYGLALPKMSVEYYQGDHHSGIKTVEFGDSLRKLLPGRLKVEASPFEQLKLAIKYQGIRLQYLYVIFESIDPHLLEEKIAQTPTSKNARVIWFLYEWLLNKRLNLPDVTSGNYVELFDSNYYFTRNTGERCRRTRVVNNALGTRDFCPTVRKTKEVKALCDIDVYALAYGKMQDFLRADGLINANIVDQCINYLYTKESRTSSQIEQELPDKQRLRRFNQALKNAGMFHLSKQALINIQNHIVADKAQIDNYRTDEIYVGETKRFGFFVDEEVHFVGPKAIHVEGMMQGLLDTHDALMSDSDMPPLMHASVVSFGIVYIHPFDDGNGRTHRYLLHDVFKLRDKRHEFIIPISATILKHPREYDKVLNVISHPLMLQLKYDLDEENEFRIVIQNDLHYLYRYPDFTEHVKYIYDVMDTSTKFELLSEVVYLVTFDSIKRFLNENADIPENHLNNLVNILINNAGQISNKKRDYALKYIDNTVLQMVEKAAVELIDDLEKHSGVDVRTLKLN